MLWRKRLLTALVVAVVVEAGVFLLLRDEDETRQPCPAGACEPPPALLVITEDALARRFAPVLYLRDQPAPCSSEGDPFNPIPVEVVLGNGEIGMRRDGAQFGAGLTAQQLFRGDPEMELDYPGDPLNPGCRYERDAARFAEGKVPTAYVRLVIDRDDERMALQYWFFYYFNPWNNRHEGDWEVVQLVFEATTLREAWDEGPIEAGYSQHSGGESARWDDDKLQRQGSSPVVYVSRGSHANFYNPAVYLGRGENRTGVGCEETRGPHRRIDPEPVLLPNLVVLRSSPFAWTTYLGRWGETAGGEFNGPRGPNTTRAWNAPFEWQSSLRTGSVRVPGSLVGPTASSALCDVIVFASNNVLDVLHATPALGGFALAAFIIGAGIGLTRTTYLPIVLRPVARRRRLGQILTASLAVFLRHLPTYMGIGLLFVPFGLIASGLGWLLLTYTPAGSLISVNPAAPGQRILLLLSLGEAQVSVAYALVTTLSVAALTLQEQRQPASIGDAARLVLRLLPQLLVARLFALTVTLLMALTILGLPFALRQAVRWAFLEQAILLDRLSIREAFRASNEAAATLWWWSFGTTVGLAALGIVLAPAAGIVLLLAFRSLDLTYVNIVTSAIYVGVTPYVAIALTMVYCNLKTLRPNPESPGR